MAVLVRVSGGAHVCIVTVHGYPKRGNRDNPGPAIGKTERCNPRDGHGQRVAQADQWLAEKLDDAEDVQLIG